MTIPKMTVSFCKILETLAVGPIYLVVSATAPFRDLTILSWTTASGQWCLWCTGLHDTIVQMIPQFFSGMAFPLKVLIWGAPKGSPVANVLIKHPTFTLGWIGVRGWGGGPWGTHPPSGCVGAGGWNGCPGGTHPPPLRKVTSWLPTSGSLLPTGFPKVLVEGFWRVHSAHRVQPPGRDPS